MLRHDLLYGRLEVCKQALVDRRVVCSEAAEPPDRAQRVKHKLCGVRPYIGLQLAGD
jgi:hypothetical protein